MVLRNPSRNDVCARHPSNASARELSTQRRG
jgi:hypothetical protein